MKQAELPSPYVLVNTIQKALPDFASVNWLDQVDSTNVFLSKQVRQDSTYLRPALVGAHHQTQGKGRAGRVFRDLNKTTLMFSCAYDVQLPVAKLPMLAPLAGVVACEQLQELLGHTTPQQLSMKWPNDILFQGSKLSGLLVESVRPQCVASQNNHFAVIIGMGLNLNDAQVISRALNRQVTDWTSVLKTLHADRHGIAYDIGLMVACIARAWAYNIKLYEQYGFEPFINRHKAIDALFGQTVNVLNEDKVVFSGIAQGIDKEARLEVKTEDGIQYVLNGDISIRPIEGIN